MSTDTGAAGLWYQVAVDCHDPHPLADWWAETLGWQVEPQDEAFIRSMVDQGYATQDETTTHRGKLVWATGCAVVPTDGSRARLLFQQVPEGKTVKNRTHLDLRGLAPEDLPAFRTRLVERGATVLHEGRQGPHTWLTMTDPEGNEFCA